MSKYFVVVNGSPRKNGNVANLLHFIAENLEANGHRVRWFDISAMQVQPCLGCMQCRKDGTCVLPADSAHEFAQEVRVCDGIVVGSPVYWGNMSGQLKLLFDRIVPVLMQEASGGLPIPKHCGKSAILVAACTTIWPFNVLCNQSVNAIHAMKEILLCAGFKIAGKIVMPGTRNKTAIPSMLFRHAEIAAAKLMKK